MAGEFGFINVDFTNLNFDFGGLSSIYDNLYKVGKHAVTEADLAEFERQKNASTTSEELVAAYNFIDDKAKLDRPVDSLDATQVFSEADLANVDTQLTLAVPDGSITTDNAKYFLYDYNKTSLNPHEVLAKDKNGTIYHTDLETAKEHNWKVQVNGGTNQWAYYTGQDADYNKSLVTNNKWNRVHTIGGSFAGSWELGLCMALLHLNTNANQMLAGSNQTLKFIQALSTKATDDAKKAREDLDAAIAKSDATAKQKAQDALDNARDELSRLSALSSKAQGEAGQIASGGNSMVESATSVSSNFFKKVENLVQTAFRS
ncbi:hypothetical protein [Noviherbaspirillum galbum]|uniref:Uncharacterized protein n=1 Tax=Noviherbaspirillum galbum TaxID=2709383 RepID=A0A6B3SUE7_9BURK|nr:hypothetical protein [Noviherbaspirillum galbum]NEX64211.1 hypothetical protein [Noviherbaspirillum galbum]